MNFYLNLMNTYGRWCLAVLLLVATLGAVGAPDQRAIVTADRVNVRGRATLNSEIVTQLNQGEEVVLLEEIPVKNPSPGEPAAWARIRLPANTPVWVFAPYIEPGQSVVNVSRLNLRAGPGENYSVLGRIERGTTVKEIRLEKNWMEIEAPGSSSAYIAASFLKPIASETVAASTAPAPAESTETPTSVPSESPTSEVTTNTVETVATTEAPAPPATSEAVTNTQSVEIEAAPVPPLDQPLDTISTPVPISPSTNEVSLPAETSPRRVVSREGRVIISRSIQAPTDYALESQDTHRTINYLHSEDLGVNLKVYAGRKVIVTGEELIDRRWTQTPILEVESIRLVP